MSKSIKLTEATKAAICRDLAAGLPRTCAAKRAGIARRTLNNWLRRGQSGVPRDAEYVDFARAVAKAEQDAVARCVALIQTAAKDDWRAAAWYLEHKFPEDWWINRKELTDLRRQLAVLIAAKNLPEIIENGYVQGQRLVSGGIPVDFPRENDGQ
jgi:transposase